MRRWNGWGDDATSMSLGEGARAMLAARLGPGLPGQDARREDLLAGIPPSRLPENRLIDRGPSTRFAMALGESYADWIRKRFGALPPVPDGVATPESTEQVRELLDLAQANRWMVIPFAGGTSVAGHLDCPVSEQPILSVNLMRLNRLLHLDTTSQLATFGAGNTCAAWGQTCRLRQKEAVAVKSRVAPIWSPGCPRPYPHEFPR